MMGNPLRLMTYFLAVFLVLIMTFVALAQTSVDLTELQKKGSELRKQGKPEEALKVFSEALTLSPRKAELFMLRGETFRSMKNYELASADFTQVLAIDDKVPQAYFARGLCYGNRKRYEEALKDFSQVITLKPDKANAYFFRALTYKHLDRYEEGLKDINQAIELNPKDHHAYYLKGEICQLSGLIPDAIAAYRKFLGHAPSTENKKIKIAKNRINNLQRRIHTVKASSQSPAASLASKKSLSREIDKKMQDIYRERTGKEISINNRVKNDESGFTEAFGERDKTQP
jgi:tetratricopeptide (TPR) repeat protein